MKDRKNNIAKITPKTMAAILETFVEKNVTEVPLHFMGPSQIGKTQIVSQVGAKYGLKVINIRVGENADVGDLIGIPRVHDGRTVWAVPEWWPEEGSEERVVGIVFLDEINRGEDDKRQALFRFLENGKLHTHELPPGWIRVAASNPYNSERIYQVAELDPAFVKRLCNIGLIPSVEDWKEYARSAGFAEAVVSYINDGGNLFVPEDFSFFVEPAPGLWEKVSILLNKGVIPHEDEKVNVALLAGLIGSDEAINFMQYLNDYKMRRVDILKKLMEKNWRRNINEIVKMPDDAWMVSAERFISELNALKKPYDPKILYRVRELIQAIYHSPLPGRKDRFVSFVTKDLYSGANEFYNALIQFERELESKGKLGKYTKLITALIFEEHKKYVEGKDKR